VDPGLLTLAEAKTAIAGMNKNSAMGPDSDSPHYSPCEEAWRHHPRRPETNIPSNLSVKLLTKMMTARLLKEITKLLRLI
jgi:hypothetical protein